MTSKFACKFSELFTAGFGCPTICNPQINIFIILADCNFCVNIFSKRSRDPSTIRLRKSRVFKKIHRENSRICSPINSIFTICSIKINITTDINSCLSSSLKCPRKILYQRFVLQGGYFRVRVLPAFDQWAHRISIIWPIRASKISSTSNAKVKA